MTPSDYLAPASPGELGMLFSFHYFAKTDMVAWMRRQAYQPTVFVDSGGFSAFTQGVSVDIKEYAGWIRRNETVLSHYANLDAIGDPRGTLTNQLRMEQFGLRPMPITHFGSDPASIATYAAHGYSYQCLGGMVPHLKGVAQALAAGRPHPLLDWLDDCFDVARQHEVGLHGFGVTTWPLMRRYAWRSVDSSAWGSGYRWGQLNVFDYRFGKWVGLSTRDKETVMRYASLIRSYGGNPISLIRDDKHSRHNMICVASRSWLAAQRYLRQPVGPRVFLADSGGIDTDTVLSIIGPRVFLVEENMRHLELAGNMLCKGDQS